MDEVIYGLTLQKVGTKLVLRCPECTVITGRIGLIEEEGPPIKLSCRVHPENFGRWSTLEEMESEKLALAKRMGLK